MALKAGRGGTGGGGDLDGGHHASNSTDKRSKVEQMITQDRSTRVRVSHLIVGFLCIAQLCIYFLLSPSVVFSA